MSKRKSSGSLITRRDAIRTLGAGALTFYFTGCTDWFKGCSLGGIDPAISPVDRTVRGGAPDGYTGEFPDTRHAVLWNKDEFIAQLPDGRLPAPSETVPLVVIGGGMSGLITAYLLREHRPLVLDQAPRLGGNSKGESWKGIDYSVGAAYFTVPTPGGAEDRLLTELGLRDKLHVHKGGGQLELKGKLRTGFWQGATDPARAEEFKRLEADFLAVAQQKGGKVFPEIPTRDPKMREAINRLDAVSFHDYLKGVAGGSLHPEVEAAIEQYCWSSFGGSAREISAAHGLNFYAGEFDGVAALPAGNATITEALVHRLAKDLPSGHLRADSLVFDVQANAEGVQVAYQDAKGRVHVIQAKAAVMACPKFIASKILRDIEAERLEAIRKIRYRAYLVANVLLNVAPPGNLRETTYDLYLLGDGRVAMDDVPASARRKLATDVILANFANPTVAGHSVLTLYRALPYEGGRPEVFSPASFAGYKEQFESQIRSLVLPLLGYRSEDLAGIRINRWGHPLPLAATGLIADGTVDRIQKPFRDRVFFVEQDNWVLPCFETACNEAYHWAPIIGKALS